MKKIDYNDFNFWVIHGDIKQHPVYSWLYVSKDGNIIISTKGGRNGDIIHQMSTYSNEYGYIFFVKL